MKQTTCKKCGMGYLSGCQVCNCDNATISIYELEKKATPGPFILADKEYYTAEPHSLVAASDPDRKIAELYTENDADDILFAHCRNNFLRALEALRNCEIKLHDAGLYIEADFLRGKIKELEEI